MQPNTLLLRQINRSFVQSGRVSSQAFRPTAKDNGKLSEYDGDIVSPETCWNHFTSAPGCSSAGVMAVSYFECELHELPVIEDRIPFPEHCSIDFSAHNNSAIDRKAKVITALARDRGWLYLAPTE